MKGPWCIVLLSACEGPDGEGQQPGSLELSFDAQPSAAGSVRFDSLSVVVREVRFEGTEDAAGTADSVALLLQDEVFEPLVNADETITMEIDQGRHADCSLAFELVTNGTAPALLATGVLPGDDGDDLRSFHLEIEAMTLSFLPGTIDVEADPWKAQVRLHPLDWLDGLTGGEDDDDLRITSASGAAYDQLVANVIAAVALEADGQ